MSERNISIGGDASHNIFLPGDNNTVSLGQPPLSPEEQKRLTGAYLQAVAGDWATLRLDEGDESGRGVPLTEVFVLLQARQAPPPRLREGRPDLAPSEERRQHAGPTPPGPTETREAVAWEAASPPPPLPLGQALQQAQHMALLGEPGSGKSTTLQFLGLCFAKREVNWPQEKLGLAEERVPLLLPLPAYAETFTTGGDALRQALVSEIARRLQVPRDTAAQLYETWAQAGRLLVLLDGLDEVPEGHQREAVRSQIEAFARAPAGRAARLVVASRIAEYAGLPGLQEYTLQPLEDPTHVRHYLQGWLAVLGQALGKGTDWDPAAQAQTLLQKMQANPALRRLLDNPLLLRLSAEVYAEQGEIARNRADLYGRYVEVAWKRAERRGAAPVLREKAWQALEVLAWHLQTGGARDEKSLVRLLQKQGLAEGEAAARDLLALLRKQMGLLARLEGDRYAFAHATLGEFFVARRLQRAWEKNPKRTRAFLRPRYHLTAWREPLRLLAGALDEPNFRALIADLWPPRYRFERLAYRRLWLAAELAAEAGRWEAVADRLWPDLRRAMGDEDYWVRQAAAEVLGKVGTPVVDGLLQALQDGDARIRETAAETLGQIDDLQAVSYLLQALRDDHWRVCRAIARALGKIGDSQAVSSLIQALRDKYVWVREAAAEALGDIGDPQSVPDLIQALKDTDREVRWAAAKALGKIGVPKAASALTQALKDEDRDLHAAAARSLGYIGTSQVASILLKVLKSEGGQVRWAAAEALSQIGASAAFPLTQALREEDEDEQVRWAIVEVLGRIGDAQAVPSLIQALQDEHWLVRRSAAEALGYIGDAQAIPELVQALQDTLCTVREAAALALGRIGDPQAMPYLSRILQNEEDERVRIAATISLSKLGSPKAFSALVQALWDESGQVRWMVAEALGNIGNPQAIPALYKTLQDKNKWVYKTSARALKAIFRAGDLPKDKIAQRQLYHWLQSRQVLRRLYQTGGASLLAAALTYRDALTAALSPWQDPLQPPSWVQRWERVKRAVRPATLALLAGLVTLLVALLGGVSAALKDWLAPLWAAQPGLALLGGVVVLGALIWALQRLLQRRS